MKIKVLHVLHAVGGVDVYLRLLIEAIDHRKFELVIVKGINDNSKPYMKPCGDLVKTYELPIDREINLINDLKSINKVVKILRNEKPNIVHAHSAKGGIIARTASILYKVNVLHTPHAYSYLSTESVFKRALFLRIERFYKNINSTLLATSQSELSRGVLEVKYKKEKAILFANSIKKIESSQNLTQEKTWPDNYICSVGRPCYQKNIELMVEIINQVKKQNEDIHLVLMGVGFHSPNLSAVKLRIKEKKLEENITLLEWTSREEIFSIISKSKLYISTSRYEGLPYSMIETLALGKPIVATDCDGNRDLVINNYNGYLIKENQTLEMPKRVLDILEDISLQEKMGLNSFNIFLDNFEISKNIKKLESIYLSNSKSFLN